MRKYLFAYPPGIVLYKRYFFYSLLLIILAKILTLGSLSIYIIKRTPPVASRVRYNAREKA